MPDIKDKGGHVSAETAKPKELAEIAVLKKVRGKYPDKAALLKADTPEAAKVAVALEATFGENKSFSGQFPILYRGNIRLSTDNKLFIVKKVS